MSMRKRLLTRAMLMLCTFLVVLVVIFSPVFPGKVNGLVYMDNLFNMISKGSCDFIPDAQAANEPFKGKSVKLSIAMTSANQAEQVQLMLQAAGARTGLNEATVTFSADLGAVVERALIDASLMYHNQGARLATAYGFSEQQLLFNWWQTLKSMQIGLNTQRDFKSAKMLDDITRRVIEPAYNYYGIEPMRWQDNIILIVAALLFYVIYTVWYGFGLLYLFEGLGLNTGH